jgi:tetrapyrrole methylase family protein/MazG family protein
MNSFDRLVQIMRKLRGKDGCPWDREQDRRSILPYLLEETYEVIDAIEEGDYERLKEELGDLILQVVFHAVLGEECGLFTLEDVLNGINKKLVSRHPHVFGSMKVSTSQDVLRHWREIKDREKKGHSHISDTLPSFLFARRALKVISDSEDREGSRRRLRERFFDLLNGNASNREEVLGEFLLSLVDFSKKEGLDPELALRRAVKRILKSAS